MKNFIRTLERLLMIPGTFDPDDLRRRRVLNFVLTIALLMIVIFLIVVGWDETEETFAIQIMTDPDTGLLIPIFLITGLIIDDADKWQMIVSDTGIGIPPERLPDIFLLFRRASDSDYATRSYQGAGLGLSIAKRIAQLAHDDIQVKSTVGHGSTFLVMLPINGGA